MFDSLHDEENSSLHFELYILFPVQVLPVQSASFMLNLVLILWSWTSTCSTAFNWQWIIKQFKQRFEEFTGRCLTLPHGEKNSAFHNIYPDSFTLGLLSVEKEERWYILMYKDPVDLSQLTQAINSGLSCPEVCGDWGCHCWRQTSQEETVESLRKWFFYTV